MENPPAEKKYGNIPQKVYFIVLFLSGFWTLLIFAAPFIIEMGGIFSWLSLLTYKFYSHVCHQVSERSFSLFGNQLAVCSRCTVIYLSFFVATLFYPFIRGAGNLKMPPLWILLTVAFIMFADAAGSAVGLFENTQFTRAVTGGMLGLVLPFYIIPGLINFVIEVKDYFKKNATDEPAAE